MTAIALVGTASLAHADAFSTSRISQYATFNRARRHRRFARRAVCHRTEQALVPPADTTARKTFIACEDRCGPMRADRMDVLRDRKHNIRAGRRLLRGRERRALRVPAPRATAAVTAAAAALRLQVRRAPATPGPLRAPPLPVKYLASQLVLVEHVRARGEQQETIIHEISWKDRALIILPAFASAFFFFFASASFLRCASSSTALLARVDDRHVAALGSPPRAPPPSRAALRSPRAAMRRGRRRRPHCRRSRRPPPSAATAAAAAAAAAATKWRRGARRTTAAAAAAAAATCRRRASAVGPASRPSSERRRSAALRRRNVLEGPVTLPGSHPLQERQGRDALAGRRVRTSWGNEKRAVGRAQNEERGGRAATSFVARPLAACLEVASATRVDDSNLAGLDRRRARLRLRPPRLDRRAHRRGGRRRRSRATPSSRALLLANTIGGGGGGGGGGAALEPGSGGGFGADGWSWMIGGGAPLGSPRDLRATIVFRFGGGAPPGSGFGRAEGFCAERRQASRGTAQC